MLDSETLTWYTIVMLIEEANLILNNEVRVTSPYSLFYGHQGIVENIMADGRTLDIKFNGEGTHRAHQGKNVFIDISLVGEIYESQYVKTAQSLGPDANSVLPHNRL